MGEREVERADVVSFLRGEERKFSEAAAQDSMSEEGRERCYLRASTLRTVAAYIERGDHVRTAERTPEMVLRAMLLDSEKEALRTGVDELAGKSYPTSFRDAEGKVSRIRRVLVAFLATGRLDLGGFNYGLCSQEREDYEARLRGAKRAKREAKKAREAGGR